MEGEGRTSCSHIHELGLYFLPLELEPAIYLWIAGHRVWV
jgi:hypothetical protein